MVEIGSRFRLTKDMGYFVDKEGNAWSSKYGKKRKLKLSISNNKGYKSYRFVVSSGTYSRWSVKVHRFQAYQKFGDVIFEKGIQVRHLNGNSLDNSWDNIEIGTTKQNHDDRTVEERKVINAKRRKLSPTQYIEVCKMLLDGASISEVAKHFNVTYTIIHTIAKGESYTDILEEGPIKISDIQMFDKKLTKAIGVLYKYANKKGIEKVELDWKVIKIDNKSHLFPKITMFKSSP